jgi:hypothetical protein
MQNRNWLRSNIQQRFKFAGRITSSLRKTNHLPAPWACAVILIILALSLTGCAHNSPACPEVVGPRAPALTEPMPSVSYSLRVQQTFKSWQEKLIAMPTTPKP